VIVVKREAADDPAGSYAAATVAAKAVIWLAIGLALFLVPEAARRARTGEDPRLVLARVLLVIAAAAAPMVAIFAVAGEPLLRAVFGDDLTLAAAALPWLGLAMALLAGSFLCVQYLLALHRAAFLAPLALAALLEPLAVQIAAPDLETVAYALLAVQSALAAALGLLAYRAVEARGAPLA
jgi:O-antigen/teichoic acid export membrane protein